MVNTSYDEQPYFEQKEDQDVNQNVKEIEKDNEIDELDSLLVTPVKQQKTENDSFSLQSRLKAYGRTKTIFKKLKPKQHTKIAQM